LVAECWLAGRDNHYLIETISNFLDYLKVAEMNGIKGAAENSDTDDLVAI
jgi:hypothetical protein